MAMMKRASTLKMAMKTVTTKTMTSTTTKTTVLTTTTLTAMPLELHQLVLGVEVKVEL